MKRYIILMVCLIFSLTASAQLKGEKTIGEIKAVEEARFAKIKQNKGEAEDDDYNRWKWHWSQRLGDSEKISKADSAFQKYLNNKPKSSTGLQTRANNYSCSSNATWQELGPNTTDNLSNYHGGIGRNIFLTYHPQYNGGTNQTIFSGGISGLWKSINDGVTWTNLNTDNLDVTACTDLAIDPINTNTMYLASGFGASSACRDFGIFTISS